MRANWRQLSVTVAVCAFACAQTAEAQITTAFQDGVSPSSSYRGSRDTILKEGAASLNFGALDRLRVTTVDIGPAGPTWTLVRWDLSSHIPPGAVVSSARITLPVLADTGPTNTFFELLRPFQEGNNTPGSGATWQTTDGSTSWGTAGAEQVGTDRGNVALGGIAGSPSGARTVTLNAAGVSLVQRWINQPATNYGLVLRGTSSNGVDYAAREAASASTRPRLEVTWDFPGNPPSSASFQDGVNGYAGTRDTYIRDNNVNDNNGANADGRTDTSPNMRSLLRFDLSSVPAGSTLATANLELEVFNASANSSSVFALRRDWVEGTSAANSGATWNTFDGSNSWQIAGASGAQDRDSAVLASFTPSSTGTVTVSLNSPAALSEIQSWINNPSNNFGFLIQGTGGDRLRWRSREHGTAGERPRLVLTFSAGTTRTISGGGDWDTGADWTPTGVPQSGDRVIAQGPGTVTKSSSASYTIGRLSLEGGVTLALNGGTVTNTGATQLEDTGDVLRLGGGTLVARGPVSQLSGTRIELPSGGTLRLGSQLAWLGGELEARGGSLVAESLSARTDVELRGELDADGLTFAGGDVDGLHVLSQATISRLKDVAFRDISGASGAAHLTIEAEALDLAAPGASFTTVGSGQANVRLIDADPLSPGERVIAYFEDRGSGTNGAGAGEARDDELNGAHVNWVHACPDTTSGEGIGSPQTAFDLTSFALYATYVSFKNVAGPNTADRILVFDTAGNGVDRGYYFEIPANRGDLVGELWWDQLGSARVVYAVTDTGYLFRWTDPGSGSGAVSPDSGFPRLVQDGGTTVTFTSPPVSDSGTFLIVAGATGSSPRLYGINRTTGALGWAVSSGLTQPITAELALETDFSARTRVFLGGGRLSGTSTAVVDADFSGGTEGFVYEDDAFRGTNSPGLASGSRSTTLGNPGAALRVQTGPNGTNMSGAWRRNFTVPANQNLVQITFDYRLILDQRHEFDELAQALFSLDGTLIGISPNDYLAELVGDGNDNGPDGDTGWRTFSTTRVLSPGQHVLRLGHFHNKSTEPPETAESRFDNVEVRTGSGAGLIARVDGTTRTVDFSSTAPPLPLVGSPFAVFDLGLFVGDQTGQIFGFDQTTMTPLSGWPVNTGGGPFQGSVWVDFFASPEQVFWGSESGQVFGYSLSGSPLSAFNPSLVDPLGDSAAIRDGVLSDGVGVLWLASQGGRLGAVDISTGNRVGPTYYFGTFNALNTLAQGFNGHFQVASPSGRYVVVNEVNDPTP